MIIAIYEGNPRGLASLKVGAQEGTLYQRKAEAL
jgi:hypothetical protein